MLKKPINFDGAKFAKKYNLDPFKDFCDDGKGNIICPSLPNLTDADFLDCVVDPPLNHIPFEKPILAPDFIVATPKIKDDPLEALQEAITESKRGEGQNKSLGLILLSVTKYIEQLHEEIEAMKTEIAELKKRVK